MPKTKRKLHLEKAREAKKLKLSQSQPCEPDLPVTQNSDVEQPDVSLQSTSASSNTSDEETIKTLLKDHVEQWTSSLSRDNLQSLAMTLHYALVVINGAKQTSAANQIADIIGKNERTVRGWKHSFFHNDGTFPDSQQGKYQRQGVLWQNEQLNEIASLFVRDNAVVKGKPNLNAISFCRWVNESILPNSCLDPGYPREISVQTARLWLHELGFEVLDKKKGVYIDGHERDDVVMHRQKFLRQLIVGGFLTPELAPSDEAKEAFPTDIDPPTLPRRQKNIFIFHDESTFNANDELLQWGTPESQIIRPKSKGSGIMVSDFIAEQDGYLCLTKAEFDAAKVNNPNLRMGARTLLEYGESWDGYWTGQKFMKQMESAVQIAEAKYPRSQDYRLFWVFDQSGCHMAFDDDSLNVNRMNAGPGGSVPCMHDTTYDGKITCMTKQVRKDGCLVRIPRGMRDVLEQRGRYTKGMKLADMRKELGSHPDFEE